MNEFDIINKITRGIRTDSSVIKGVGDDCAVIKFTNREHLLCATDMIIEGVHFKKNAAPESIGHKALAVNISDIAACGGIPKWAVVSVGFPKNIKYGYIDRVFKGLRRLAGRYDINIVGGDTNSSNKIIVSVTLLGVVKTNHLVLRSTAKDKDAIVITGALKSRPDDLTFIPRLKESRKLVKDLKINSMIDISDGFLSDLTHVLESSNKSAIIYESLIPNISKRLPASKLLNTGEQFDLLFTIPKSQIKKLPNHCIVVGEIVDGNKEITLVTREGRRSRVKPLGYRHF
ncbi:thiamine-monophosphate kinase [Candidatus Omnitrophota bacterium]